MNLDLNGYRIHLVFSPTDMRSGYRTLSAIASSCLQLDMGWGAKFGPEGSSIIGSPSGNPE